MLKLSAVNPQGLNATFAIEHLSKREIINGIYYAFIICRSCLVCNKNNVKLLSVRFLVFVFRFPYGKRVNWKTNVAYRKFNTNKYCQNLIFL